MPWRTAPAWPDSPPPITVHHDVELAEPVGDDEGLVEQHAQHRPREIDRAVAAVDLILPLPGLIHTRATAFLRLPVA